MVSVTMEMVFFRAVLTCLNGRESDQITFKLAFVQQLDTLQGAESDKAPNNWILMSFIENLKQSDTWLGEGIILATAAYFRRFVRAYMACGNSSPHVYSVSTTANAPPISVAFNEPRNLKAVCASGS